MEGVTFNQGYMESLLWQSTGIVNDAAGKQVALDVATQVGKEVAIQGAIMATGEVAELVYGSFLLGEVTVLGRAGGEAAEATQVAQGVETATTKALPAATTKSAQFTSAEAKLEAAAQGEASTGTNFLVDHSGQTFPVPKGATGPNPSYNPAGKQTGVSYTGGQGGANGKVASMRVMDAVPAKGKSPGYPNGYVKYENAATPKPQGVDPYSGKTGPPAEVHFPIQP